MKLGNKANDDGNLIPSQVERDEFVKARPISERNLRSNELNTGSVRYCSWILDIAAAEVRIIQVIDECCERCAKFRRDSNDGGNKSLAQRPNQVREMYEAEKHTLFVSIMTSK